MINVYLDNCCYNRPFDDLRQERIKLETRSNRINYRYVSKQKNKDIYKQGY